MDSICRRVDGHINASRNRVGQVNENKALTEGVLRTL
jgi:hypothetical protein